MTSVEAEVRDVNGPDLMVVVTVSPGRDGERGDLEYLVNYSKRSVKDWLTKTTVWAVTNGRSVELRSATSQDLASRRQFKPEGREDRTDDQSLGSRQ